MEAIFGAVLWLLANVVYWDDRRRGRDEGFRRIVAFIFGWPATFVTFLAVSEGSVPPARRDDTGLDELVDRIREDRRRRELGSPASDRGGAADDPGSTGLPTGGCDDSGASSASLPPRTESE